VWKDVVASARRQGVAIDLEPERDRAGSPAGPGSVDNLLEGVSLASPRQDLIELGGVVPQHPATDVGRKVTEHRVEVLLRPGRGRSGAYIGLDQHVVTPMSSMSFVGPTFSYQNIT